MDGAAGEAGNPNRQRRENDCEPGGFHHDALRSSPVAMFMAPAMPFFDDARRKASRHAERDETEEQGNSEFSHERLQALLL
jgi:hypothetical protein